MFDLLILLGKNATIVIAAMLPIMNPVGGAPIFLSMTKDIKGDARHFLVRRVAINASVITAAAMVFGSYILAFFGISEAAVRIGGGMLVIATGWRLLHADEPEAKTDIDETRMPDITMVQRRAFYPLAFPLTTGPGSISVAITLGARVWADKGHKVVALMGAAIGIVITGCVVYVCYRFAGRMIQWLGDSGAQVLLRFAAFILLCIGVQIAWEGIAQLVHQFS